MEVKTMTKAVLDKIFKTKCNKTNKPYYNMSYGIKEGEVPVCS